MDLIGDCEEFTRLYVQKTKKVFSGKIDRAFIRQMVIDELDELMEAKDETEEVDALLDAVYYILQHLATTDLDVRPIWNMIHKANMTKFGEGGRMAENGKWLKPPNFVPPDEEIRKEIENQRRSKV